MNHGDSLKTVARVVGNEEREMARRMSDCRTKLETDEERLLSLRQYRKQYLKGFHGMEGCCLNPVQLQDYRAFLAKLDQAIAEQHHMVEQSRAAFESLQLQWQKLHGENKALQKLILKRQKSQLLEQSRREQKELDERAGWAHRNNGMS
ncbi:flagellar export protein FliJ [Thiolapillus brandeum]|uniref:Flagellar FliJ protein n=1 Tax=Thiolapillus brandeum TaxID=1076588 RepID=A0A7U6GIN6_9GAMM|nr:flagellar export protein FliJ [Thiolapillus brandeum]BAO44310.1 flagellar FliJ protein [Thiolapillus brandeum]